MLSRLHGAARAGSLLKCCGQFQIPAALSSSTAPLKQTCSENSEPGQRMQRLEHPPPVKMGFIPKAWFDAFYPKTGVSGPYMFMVGTSVYLLSKEIFVLDPEFYHALACVIAMVTIHQKFGDKIFKTVSDIQEKYIKDQDEKTLSEKQHLKDSMADMEKQVWYSENLNKFLPETKRENINLEREAIYRERLQEIYAMTKRRLDYQVEKENLERRMAQKNLVDWVLRSVMESITPAEKKNALTKCIADLKTLTAKA